MVYKLACESENYDTGRLFSGFVPVGYPISGGDTFDDIAKNCGGFQSSMLIQFHGTKDEVVNYETGILDAPGAAEGFEIWSKTNSCSQNAESDKVIELSETTTCIRRLCSKYIAYESQLFCTVEGGDQYLYDDVSPNGLAAEALKILQGNRLY